ncbi:hypothetical protein ACHAXR_008806, partial [Thalassiosira sp. AJA248-18]
MKLSSLALFIATATAKKPDPVPQDAPPVPQDAICLNQADFDQGTKFISTPGTYKLCQDISFGPNGPEAGKLPNEDAFDPVFNGLYSTNEFGLGFFAALCIASPYVTIHLDGHTIEQSAGHALMQRFFSVIELASSPFIRSAGPAQFVGDGEAFLPASNVNIFGPGVIGRSSHHGRSMACLCDNDVVLYVTLSLANAHRSKYYFDYHEGIHGNDNTNVKITDIKFIDFEVAAVSLNNVDTLEISNCVIERNRQDVPVVGLFSAARFLRPYGKYLKSQGYKMELYDYQTKTTRTKSAVDVYDNLIAAIDNVYGDIIGSDGKINESNHPDEYNLFNNPFNVVDGPCYAFLVHGRGPAVGGQGENFNEDDGTATSSNVVIKNNTIKNIKCWNNEVPALFGDCGGHGCVVNDARGSVFQTVKTFDNQNPHLAIGEDGTYNGNVVSDMQIMVAQAIFDGNLTDIPSRQIGPNSIHRGIIDWAQDGSVMEPQYVCNGDSMHHVVKGIIAIRLEDTAGFSIEGNSIQNVENLSVEPFANCDSYHIGSSSENLDEQQAGNVRAISVAAVRGYDTGSRYSQIKNNEIHGVLSEEANVIIGIDVQGDSKHAKIVDNTVNLQDDIFGDPNDSLIAVRIREAVEGSIPMHGNILAQETQRLTGNGIRGRARALKKLHAHASGDIEWKM